jgi:hypothetical protein
MVSSFPFQNPEDAAIFKSVFWERHPPQNWGDTLVFNRL